MNKKPTSGENTLNDQQLRARLQTGLRKLGEQNERQAR